MTVVDGQAANIVTIGGVTYGYLAIAPPFKRRTECVFRLTYGQWIPSHIRTARGTLPFSAGYRPDTSAVAALDRAYIEREAEDADDDDEFRHQGY